MSNIFKNNLSERVYSATDEDELLIDTKVNAFYKEITKRKENSEQEGGLQMSGVIFPSSFALMINEDDGIAPHVITQMNLIRYLNGEKTFFETEVSNRPILYKKELENLDQNGIELRMICSNEELLVIALTQNKINEFEAKTLQGILKICIEMLKCEFIKNIQFGIKIEDETIDPFEDSLNENNCFKYLYFLKSNTIKESININK